MPNTYDISKLKGISLSLPVSKRKVLDEEIGKISEFIKQYDEQSMTIQKNVKEIADLKNSIDKFIADQKENTNIITELKNANQKLADDANNLTNLLTEKSNKIILLNNEKNKLIENNLILENDLKNKGKDIEKYQKEFANLTVEYNKIKELYDAIKTQKQRPIATPTQLSASFKEALDNMRTTLSTNNESSVDYIVSRFDVTLKTGIGIDSNDKVSFQLPKEEEISAPENLSTIQFSIRSVPKVKI
jgi:eukaryotic-like serine/threonine-protein kinase